METELIQALKELGDNGFWAIFWYSLFRALPELLFIGALIIGVRAAWKNITGGPPEQ